jgi:alkylation response protein AidB-like acyl-CoA dehydrogenase
MRFELTDDQQAIRETARDFLADRYRPEEVRRLALEDDRGFTDDQWDAVAELGWPALVVAEDDGGLGLGVGASA